MLDPDIYLQLQTLHGINHLTKLIKASTDLIMNNKYFCEYRLDHLFIGKPMNLWVQMPGSKPGDPVSNEWIAFNVFHFVDRVASLWNLIKQRCRSLTVRDLSRGQAFRGSCILADMGYEKPILEKMKKSNKLKDPYITSADYVDRLMEYLYAQQKTSTFPDDDKENYPSDFLRVVSEMMTKIIQIMSHIYIGHRDALGALSLWPHVNTLFANIFIFGENHYITSPSSIPERLRKFSDELRHEINRSVQRNESDSKS